MKKTGKLTLKKVTLRDLDESKLQPIAGGVTATCYVTCPTCRATYIKCIE